MDKQQAASTVNKVLDEMRQRPVIGISSRHIHLAAADYAELFPRSPSSRKKRCYSRDNMLQSRR